MITSVHCSYYLDSTYRLIPGPLYISTHTGTSNKMLTGKSIALITQVKNSISLTLCPSSPPLQLGNQ